MTANLLKRVVCVAAISSIALVAAGCDDDDNNKKHRHAHRDDHRRYDDRRDYRPPPPPPPPPRGKNIKERPPRDGKRPPRPPREKKAMEGVYSATALNDASVQKGKSYYVDIFEDNGEMFLELPNGKEYPITFENGAGTVAGGNILEQDEGKFFYTDKKGGAWLIEKVDE